MKPSVKNDSWCYTASKTAARQRLKRLSAKRHRRQEDRGEGFGPPDFFARSEVAEKEIEAARKWFSTSKEHEGGKSGVRSVSHGTFWLEHERIGTLCANLGL
jgi:hypothetical protein